MAGHVGTLMRLFGVTVLLCVSALGAPGTSVAQMASSATDSGVFPLLAPSEAGSVLASRFDMTEAAGPATVMLNAPSGPEVYGIGVFELDGNAVPFNFTAPPTVTVSATDWFSIYNKTLTPSLTLANITSVGFRLDGTGSTEDIFQPSSKITRN